MRKAVIIKNIDDTVPALGNRCDAILKAETASKELKAKATDLKEKLKMHADKVVVFNQKSAEVNVGVEVFNKSVDELKDDFAAINDQVSAEAHARTLSLVDFQAIGTRV